jgi:hypothetical protein
MSIHIREAEWDLTASLCVPHGLYQVGSQIGVGKESDIYEAQTDSGEEVRRPTHGPNALEPFFLAFQNASSFFFYLFKTRGCEAHLSV